MIQLEQGSAADDPMSPLVKGKRPSVLLFNTAGLSKSSRCIEREGSEERSKKYEELSAPINTTVRTDLEMSFGNNDII
jgi:hypothetical protein